MRRCLQTCDIIFKDHPSKPQIIVDPDVREVFSSSCDIGGRIRQGIQEFPYFDFSKIKDHDAWYIHSIKNEEVKKKLLEKLEDGNNEDNRNEKARKILLEYIEEHALKNDRLTLSDFPAQKKNLRKLS